MRNWGPVHGDRSAEFRSEVAAFYAGFGQPHLLRAAFDEASLYVPVTADDRVCMSRAGGVDWLCAFTSAQEFARYMVARGVSAAETYRYHILLGSRLSEWARTQLKPTGVSVDCVGAAPMAFPPELRKPVGEVARG
ncbi:hypothetical protein JK358_35890 [Nocardia sp. 2]|uniref:SseB protein N-terminal domain-containing protein n=1 Tax=Nocardia acididurans TaxID=2802282 RepID=A0ABS1MGJ7_9NOCA|nr:hypothetical protein [Nocardia acididurans]MBL1079798.1 hypothetical protein [Nocardia acididurans]